MVTEGLLQACFIGNRELMAALLAPAGQYFTAVFGRHSAAKTMLVLA